MKLCKVFIAKCGSVWIKEQAIHINILRAAPLNKHLKTHSWQSKA